MITSIKQYTLEKKFKAGLLLKIAQVAGHFHSRYYSSNEQFLSRELAKLGHEVVVFTTRKRAKWQTVESDEVENKIQMVNGFIVKRIFSGPEIGIDPLMPSLLPMLIDEEIDIIHAHNFYNALSFYCAMAAKAKRIPLIITQHNDQLPSHIVRRFLYTFDSHTFGKYVLSQANKIIALTSDIRLHLLHMGADKNKLEVIPNAVDTNFFSPNRRNFLDAKWGISESVILFVGRLVEEKGVKYLLYALSRVVRKIPEAKLVIVGEGPKEGELRSLQTKLRIPHVFFLGAVENSVMPNIYVGADVVVLPSIREPFGNVVIEAMASGKPVIGSYVGGIKDTIIHGVTGYHVQPKNSGQISGFLLKFFSDPSLREQMEENARKRAVENYDQELLIKKIEKIYVELLG